MRKSLMLCALVGACVWMVEAKTLKVLMIGNSFTESAMRETPAVAKAMGCALDLANLCIGGCPLSKHWANVEKAGDPDFRPYAVQMSWTSCDAKASGLRRAAPKGRANIPQALAAEPWDIVTIQQASGQSAFEKTYQPYADNLVAKIRELAPQAEIRIQETWSYSPYDGRLGVWKFTPDEMFARLHAAYGALARKHGLKIIPTAVAVQNYRRDLPVRYAKVYTKQELAAFAEPRLPDFYGDVCGKAHWGKGSSWRKDADERKLRVDGCHLNPAGEYLQGCVWVAALFGVDVTACPYRPDFVPEDRAALMRRAAMAAVRAAK